MAVTLGGWHPTHTTFTTAPINPELDIILAGDIILTSHPTDPSLLLLYKPNDTLISILQRNIIDKLHSLFRTDTQNLTFEEALAKLIYGTNTHTYINKALRELRLTCPSRSSSQHQILKGTWPIPDDLYLSLYSAFGIQRILDCNPMNIPLAAQEYYSKNPEDQMFSAGLHTDTIWPECPSLSQSTRRRH